MGIHFRVRRPLATATFLTVTFLLAGCGAAVASSGSAGNGSAISHTVASAASRLATTTSAVSPTPTPGASHLSGPLNPAATVTNADAGKTFQIQVGDVIDVDLQARSGFENWQIAPPNSAILTPTVNPAAAAVRGATLRAFRAVGAGQTDITATDLPICAAGQACPQVVQGFKATIIVKGN